MPVSVQTQALSRPQFCLPDGCGQTPRKKEEQNKLPTDPFKTLRCPEPNVISLYPNPNELLLQVLCGLFLKPSKYLSFPAHFSKEFHGLLCENLCLFLILSLFSESLGITRFGVSTAHCWSVCQCYTSFYILYLLNCLFYRLKSLRLKTVLYFSSSFWPSLNLYQLLLYFGK